MSRNFFTTIKETTTTFQNDFMQEKTIFKSSSHKLCYMYLYSMVRAERNFPSIDEIGIAICTSRSTTIRVIESMELMGFISIKRSRGKNNIYTLHDYYVVEDKISSAKLTPVSKRHSKQCQNETSVNLEPVSNWHSNTSTNNSFSSFSHLLVSSEDNIKIIDKKFKDQFANVPFERIRKKLCKDALANKITIKSLNQYEGMLEYRLKNYSPPTSAPRGQNRTKTPIRTENTPEWFEESDEYYKKLEEEGKLKKQSENDVAAKKREIDKLLKEIDGE